jgi:hypothetical protein
MLLLALRRLSTWHVLPVALGLHGLLFLMPVPSSEPVAEKPKSDSVTVVNLPKPKPQKLVQPTPKAKPSPSVKPSPIVQKITPTIVTPQPSPIALQSPIPSPSPSVTPSPSITPSPSPTDVLQIEGAQPGCNGRIGCWQMAETKGRIIAETLEQQLQKQGYELRKLELDDDTGIQVYEVAKDGTRQYFLHLIWSDRGTVYVRNPEILSRGQLEAQIGT